MNEIAEKFKVEWARCRDWVQDAIEAGGNLYSLDEVAIACCMGKMQFWPGNTCAVVTEIAEYPREKHLCVVFAGGDLKEIISMIPMFEDWGRAWGANKLVEVGRPGWEKALATDGWKKHAVVLYKPIAPVQRH